MVVSSRQPYADLPLSGEAERRASAAGVLRHEPMQAKRDTLTESLLAGHN
jgi:hypothetical protein